MSALQEKYHVAPRYGPPPSSYGERREILLVREFPTAGPDARHLRLIEPIDHPSAGAQGPEQNAPGDTLKWLGDVYSFVARQDPHSAMGVLFAHVDDMLTEGAFRLCDTLLKTIDPKRLDTYLLVATLSVTRRAANQLSERRAFVQRVRARLERLAPDRVESLLFGLD